LVFWLTHQITRSIPVAGWAAACALAIEPRLYGYPKVLVCVVAVWLAFRYVDRPGRVPAVALGAWGGVGFLFRHDLGVYLALFAAVTLLLVRGRCDVRGLVWDAATAGAVAVALVAPYVW
jgi:hypothetical protein